jgi:hypothetical protein
VPEDKVVLGLVGGGPEQQLQLLADAIGQRHRPTRCSRLRCPELAANVGPHDADLLRGPVDVPPP